ARRPTSRLVRAKSSRTEVGSPTSEGTASVFAPLASSATASSISLRRPDRTTAYPSRASASAAALPPPDPAPVTSATLVFVDMVWSPPFGCLEGTSWLGDDQEGAATLILSAFRPQSCHLASDRQFPDVVGV